VGISGDAYRVQAGGFLAVAVDRIVGCIDAAKNGVAVGGESYAFYTAALRLASRGNERCHIERKTASMC